MGRRVAKGLAGWRGWAAAAAAVVGLSIGAVSHGAESAAPVKLRIGGDASETRVVLEVDRSVSAQVVQDGSGDQKVVLAFSNLKIGGDLDGQGHGLVKAWSLARSAGKPSLSLDLSNKAHIRRRFLLPPGDGLTVYRYVIDLDGEGGPPATQGPTAAAAPVAATPAATAESVGAHLFRAAIEQVATIQARASSRPISLRKVIVIDAGHGGHDPGALGGDHREKDITLAAAKALRARLERSGRFKVVMTRDRDVFVPLETRVQIARQANADLFISLHADSGADPNVRGATVYTLSDRGEDRAARGVFETGSFLNVKLPGHDQSVKQILLDLTQRATRNRSGAFAETLIDQIGSQTNLTSHSHRDAGYMVLLAPDVPAVLLEMGFISNRQDEAQLTDPEHRARLMDAVGDAIETYFGDTLRYAAR